VIWRTTEYPTVPVNGAEVSTVNPAAVRDVTAAVTDNDGTSRTTV
jgi:hypothetical protein